MNATSQHELSEHQWQLAHIIARELVLQNADVNELGKAKAYLRTVANRADGGTRFLKYLGTLAQQGDRIGHSQSTREYFATMNRVCRKYIQGEDLKNTTSLMTIIGWVFRLMHYYKEGGLVPTANNPPEEKPATPQKSPQPGIDLNQVLEAKVVTIKGNKVTYEMFGTMRLTEKEPTKASCLKENQMVKVQVVGLKEDGSLKKVKLLALEN